MSDHMSVDLIVDMRSDTVTRPTPAMRESMAIAAVGDDVFGDDPTINRLEGRVAELLGKEAALFVPSGTMANQLAMRAQTRSGDEVLLHGRAQIFQLRIGSRRGPLGCHLSADQRFRKVLPGHDLRFRKVLPGPDRGRT